VIGAAIKVAKIATGEIAEDIDEDEKDKAAQTVPTANRNRKIRAAEMSGSLQSPRCIGPRRRFV